MNELEFYDATGDGAACRAGRRSTSPAAATAIPTPRPGGPTATGSATSTASSTRRPTSSTVIGGGSPVVPLPDFADALKTQRVLHAAIESARNRAPVDGR